jgi:16S rRNA G1207 methylase RsmC
MSVLEKETGLDELKTCLRNTWMTGDYGRFSRYMERDAESFYQRLPIERGAQLLDVGCGAGQLSLIAARAGVRVTGCDIAANWLAQARRNTNAGIEVRAGQAIRAPKGEWVQYSTPREGGAEYVAICLPAFSSDKVHKVHRDE